MESLLLLVQRREEMVSREEIAEHLRGKTSSSMSIIGINTAICKVRLAPRRIRTIRISLRRGAERIRLAAPVTRSNVWVRRGRSTQITISRRPRGPTVAGSGKEHTFPLRPLACWAGHSCTRPASPSLSAVPQCRTGNRQPAIKSLAVLPLKNLSGDPAQEYLADGMTEALIGRLSSDPRSARHFPHVGDALQESAALGARYRQNAGTSMPLSKGR